MGLVSDIGQTSLRLGDIQARGAENLGAIRAQQLQQQGQIEAQRAQNTGQLVTNLAQIGVQGLQQWGQQKQADEINKKTNAIMSAIPVDENGLANTAEIAQRMRAANFSSDQIAKAIEPLDKMNTVGVSYLNAKREQAKQAEAERIAHLGKAGQAFADMFPDGEPILPEQFNAATKFFEKLGIVKPQESQQTQQEVAAGRDPRQIINALLSSTKKPAEDFTLGPDQTRFNGQGKPIASGAPKPPEQPKNEAELALAAAGTGPDAERAKSALAALQGPRATTEAETIRHNKELERIQALSEGRTEAAARETARHNRATEAAANPFGSGMAASPGGSAPVSTGATGADFLKTVPPGVATTVKALAEGRMSFPTGAALRAPYWQGMLEAVGKYDPTFDAVNYNARSKTRADFTSGASAKQVNALNTVAGHLSDLSSAADKLGNGSIPFLNAAKNFVSKASGGSSVTNFDTAKQAVADELTRVWRQSGGTEQDIKGWQSSIDAANSPAQLHDAFATIGGLLESKLEALQNQYQQGMGIADVQMISPKARAALDKLEGRKSGPSAPTVTAPSVAPPAKVGRFEIVGVK